MQFIFCFLFINMFTRTRRLLPSIYPHPFTTTTSSPSSSVLYSIKGSSASDGSNGSIKRYNSSSYSDYIQSYNGLFNDNNIIESIQLPKTRSFIDIPVAPPSLTPSPETLKYHIHGSFRVLQFNMLADGLFGLRQDLGAFSRTKSEDVRWVKRRSQIIYEILQYKPDIITLQECDHYYDWFLPELTKYGYDGLFAPKPASACLEVSENSDGCSIFIRRSKLRYVSSETLTFVLSKADAHDKNVPTAHGEDDRLLRPQNQVALIAICEIVNDGNSSSNSISPVSLILATTHLKAAKNIAGERYRHKELLQLLSAVDRIYASLQGNSNDDDVSSRSNDSKPVILLTGDLNAAPDSESTGYSSLAYEAVKSHALGLRSVMNDDLQSVYNGDDLYTTWKARRKGGVEHVVKHCIDYIMYKPPTIATANKTGSVISSPGIRATAALSLYNSKDVGITLLPSPSYPSDHLAIAADFDIIEPI